MKFICDVMVGSLAKWLRVLGVDTIYDPSYKRSDIIRVARDEERTILTRAAKFQEIKHIPQFLLIKSEDVKEQLKEVFDALPEIKSGRMFSLCVKCNSRLTKVSKEHVKSLVLPITYLLQSSFYQCPTCHKVFWEGSHVEKMRRFITGLGL